MIWVPFFGKRRRTRAKEKPAAAQSPEIPAQQAGKTSQFNGGITERTQNLLGGHHDGERVGFRVPIQG
ncbi:MAG: hypothetical protein WBX25_22315 [Rhodomicrobium sp.]